MLSLIMNKRNEQEASTTLCDDPVHIPLISAYVCLDCSSVGNCAMQCPACASTMLMGLAGVLNREVHATVSAIDAQMEYEYIPELVA